MNEHGKLHVTERDGVAHVTLSNPARRNAITVQMWRDLHASFERFAQDAALRCVVVRGEGGHFAAGADISEFPQFRFDEGTLCAYHEEVIAPALDAIWRCDVPIVAVIEGNCIGGGLEIASCCDIRLASTNAVLGAPIAKLGFPMAPLEFAALARAFGVAAVREMLLVPRLLSAELALARGLVSQLSDAAQLQLDVDDTVNTILHIPNLISRKNKHTARCITESRLNESRAGHFDYAGSEAHRAGIEAFLKTHDKR
jgi:enoyl-CoA hydratase